MSKEYLDSFVRIAELFFEKLKRKTDWRRDEIIKIYRESVNAALMELLDD